MENRYAMGLANPVTQPVFIPDEVEYKGSVLESDRVLPQVIEGAEILDTLCPVNKFNGHRENPLSLLGKITGADSRLLNSILQELPTITSDPSMTDEDRVNYLVPRLSSGTPAEQAIIAEHMLRNLDALGLSSKKSADVVNDVKQTIEFENGDVPKSE